MQSAATDDVTCSQCGVRSPLGQAFSRVRRRRKSLTLCPACVRDEAHRSTKASLVGVAFAVGIGALVIAASGDRAHSGWVVVNFGLLQVMLWLSILPHELGHALATRAVGLRAYLVVIGTGRRLFSFSIAGVPIDVHALPLGGLTFIEIRDGPWARLKNIVGVLGGPLVNVAVLWAALTWGENRWIAEEVGAGLAPVTTLVVANVLILIGNLWPRGVQTHIGRSHTDGSQLVRLIFKRDRDFSALAQASIAAEIAVLAMHGRNEQAIELGRQAVLRYPDDPALRLALSAALLNTHRFSEGRDLLLSMPKELPRDIEAAVANNVAWANLHLGGSELTDQARELSAHAHSLMPWERYVISTRGCVEALYGDAELALRLLTSDRVRENYDKTRASTLSALASAYSRLGRNDDSRRALALAEKADRACPLLGIVRQRLASQSAAS